ncbi:MAG: hypothetical protein Q8R78_04380, partial [Candidatus Omnitrophota bacterium]|nr:hypothetical protein [Candidatus Omnitrophota bacterium]
MTVHSTTLRDLATTMTVPTPELAWIPLLPLAAFALIILMGRRMGRLAAWLSVAALASSCLIVGALAPGVFRGDRLVLSWAWLS